MLLPRIAVTPGEPAGIGIDLVIELAAHNLAAELIIIADPKIIKARAELLKKPLKINTYNQETPDITIKTSMPSLTVLPITAPKEVKPGEPSTENAGYILQTLERAVTGCLNGEFDAMCTGPVNKAILCKAGIPFSGHTEFLAEKTHSKEVVMMLSCEGLRVSLVTTHLPLSAVSAAITQEKLESVIRVTHTALKSWFGIESPKVSVLGLNPHAGENGTLGREEIDVILPVINKLQREGMLISGPVPADTAFTHKRLTEQDAVVAMYHDQGLPVLKHLGFGKSVNISLGLPIIRTSVDHGTAFDLAGSGKADANSFIYAIEIAIHMASIKKTGKSL